MCVNNNYFYCTQNDQCSATKIQYQSCEQGIDTCIAYRTTDYGIKEIAPYNTTYTGFNFTVEEGQSAKFAISNQDPTDKAWYKFKVSEKDNNTAFYDTLPSGASLQYFNPNNYTASA